MAQQIQIRRDTTANWETEDPVLAQGELGWDVTVGELRVGDGTSAWSEIDPFSAGGSYTDADVLAVLVTALGYNSGTGLIADGTLPGSIARDSEITAAVAAVVDSAPGTLNTLNELAAALADDAAFSTTVTNALAAKATPAQIATAVSDHNVSGAAHADIRALIGAGGGGGTYYAGVAFEDEPLTSHALYATLPEDQVVALLGGASSGIYTTDGTEDLVGPNDVVFADYDVVHAATGAANITAAIGGVTNSGAVYVRDPVLDGWHRLSSMNAGDVQVGDTFAGNLTLGPTDVLGTALTQIDGLPLGGEIDLTDLIRTIEAPSDDVTVTTIAPSDHLITQVVATPSNGERAIVVEPDPALVPLGALLIETVGPPTDVLLLQNGMSAGWDSGAGSWPDPDPVPATGSGFAGSTFGIGDVGGDTNLAGGVSLTFGGYSGGNGHRWRADTDLPGGPLNSVVVSNVAVTGAPADVIIGIAIADGGTPITGWVFSGSGGDITLTPDDPITDLDDIGVLVYVFTTGGAPVPPDSITFDSIDWFTDIDVASVYLGFNNNHTDGTGELNMPFSGPHTHTCTDGTFSPFKSVLKQSDGIAWNLLAGPPRAEYVSTAPYDPFAGIMLGVSNADQALKAIETWINDATMPLGAWSNPHITEDQTEPPGAPDGDFWVHPPA